METGAKVDLRGWDRAINAMAKEWGIGAADLMRYNFGLWAQDLVKKTWPKRKDLARAISNDIQRAFTVVEVTKVKGQMSESEALSHHEQSRNPRNGRVDRAYGKSGGMFRPVIGQSLFKRIVKKKQLGMGQVHAGWLSMLYKFGGKKPAKWIDRHSSTKGGMAADHMKKDGNGYLVAENRVKYAEMMITRKGVLKATRDSRERWMRDHMDKHQERICAKFNKAAA